ncbi:hypothetical protein [Aeribacillus pallidus]|uniref:hypothetical protein n=1 Tax=Aeribacillus pallidus TaxID=33936 RepID=UPI003D260891
MIVFEKNEISKLEVELDIMNSNPAYNIISKDREKIDEEDIRNEYLECKRLNTERLLVKQNDAYIGLIDYCLENPSDNLRGSACLSFIKSIKEMELLLSFISLLRI